MKYKLIITAALVFCFSQNTNAQESDLSAADGDSDGKVTVAEFREYAEGKLRDFEKMDAFVKAVDADGNGEISKSEFNARMDVLESVGMSDDSDQDDKKAEKKKVVKKSDGKNSPARKSFEKMAALIKKNKLEDAAKYMTQQGANDFAVSQVMAAIGMTEMDLPMSIPAIDEAVDEIENVMIKHKLDKLDIDTSKMFKVEMSIDDGLDEDEEEGQDQQETETSNKSEKKKAAADKAKKELDDTNKKIIAGIDADGKRWQIIGDLMKAKSGSPFGIVLLVGDVKKVEQEKKVAYLTITPDMNAAGGGDSGVVMQMVAPPTVIKMTKSGDDWKFDGVDEERTQKAMKKFMKSQNFGPSPDMNDF